MKAHHLSSSKVWLARRCAWWAQGTVDLPPDPTGPHAKHGTAVHDLVHLALTRRRWNADATPRAQDQARRVLRWLGENAPAVVTSEVKMILDVQEERTREVLFGGHRNYGDFSARELPGSTDFMWLDAAAGEAVVLDLKTGDPRYGDTPPAAESAQLATLGLAAACLYGVDKARVGHLFVSDDDIRTDWHALSTEALHLVTEDLAAILSGIEHGEPPAPGPWCSRCPARTVCPATQSAIQTLPTAKLATPEDLARAYAQLAPIEDTLAAVKRMIREHVEAHGVLPLADGSRLAIIEVAGRESVSVKEIPESMLEVLRDTGVVKKSGPSKQLRVLKSGRAA